jgi:hypothetical protein
MSNDSQEHAIREKAYAKWEQAGCPSGDGIHFWLEAEKEFQLTEATGTALDTPAPKASVASSFRAVDPPPLKLNKGAGQSRKKAG